MTNHEKMTSNYFMRCIESPVRSSYLSQNNTVMKYCEILSRPTSEREQQGSLFCSTWKCTKSCWKVAIDLPSPKIASQLEATMKVGAWIPAPHCKLLGMR
mmetsp:Transcript_32875/g.49607  ORF Transcript_32875/g.49607 Transcript_32875/m.49607 type:complete len:100 (-) Transcript_32875:668-967(-)